MNAHGPGWRVLLALVMGVGLAHWAVLNGWTQSNADPPAPGPRPPVALHTTVVPPLTAASAAPTNPPPSHAAHTAAAAVVAPAAVPPAPRRAQAPVQAPPHREAPPPDRAPADPEIDTTAPAQEAVTATPAPSQAAVQPVNTALSAVAEPSPAAGPASAAQAHTTPPAPVRWAPAARLTYDVQATRKGIHLPATAVLLWQPDGSAYRAQLTLDALLWGSRRQTSVGTLHPAQGLQPTRFGDKTRSERATHFDRSRTPPVLRFSANAPDAPLHPHTQDRLSVLLQLGAMLAGDATRFAPGSTVSVHTAGPRDADVWPFRVGATAPLDLPVGTLAATHLQREPLHPYDNRLEVWLAPDLHHLPVRIRITQANGDTVDQQLAQHERLPVASP